MSLHASHALLYIWLAALRFLPVEPELICFFVSICFKFVFCVFVLVCCVVWFDSVGSPGSSVRASSLLFRNAFPIACVPGSCLFVSRAFVCLFVSLLFGSRLLPPLPLNVFQRKCALLVRSYFPWLRGGMCCLVGSWGCAACFVRQFYACRTRRGHGICNMHGPILQGPDPSVSERECIGLAHPLCPSTVTDPPLYTK